MRLARASHAGNSFLPGWKARMVLPWMLNVSSADAFPASAWAFRSFTICGKRRDPRVFGSHVLAGRRARRQLPSNAQSRAASNAGPDSMCTVRVSRRLRSDHRSDDLLRIRPGKRPGKTPRPMSRSIQSTQRAQSVSCFVEMVRVAETADRDHSKSARGPATYSGPLREKD